MSFFFNKYALGIKNLLKIAHSIENGRYHERYTPLESDKGDLEKLGRSLNEISLQHKKLNEKVSQKENENQAFIESISDGVLVIDYKDKILRINSKFSSIFNLDHKNYSGLLIHEVIRSESFLNFIKKIKMDNVSQNSKLEIQLDSQSKLLQVSVNPLINSEKKETGWVFILNDMTHVQKLELYRKEFISNISHELKTPITSIKGFVETIIDNPKLSQKEQGEFLKIVLRQADRLTMIFDNLLVLSRIEREGGEIPKEKGSLKKLLERVLEWSKEKAWQKKIKIQSKFDFAQNSDFELLMNAPLMEQAIFNLIDNAIIYSPSETEVYLSAQVVDSQLIISIKDQGAGIAKEHHERLFERFYRTESARNTEKEGSGLGLSIVKHVVSQHGGVIRVKSEPARGSEFSIVFSIA